MQESSLGVRRAMLTDRAAVAMCVDAAYAPFIEPIGTTPAPMLDDYGLLIDQHHVWVSHNGEDLLGVIVMWAESDHWYVDNIAVGPDHQGSGVGSRLLDVAEHEARLAQRDEIRLYTNEAMLSNVDFYTSRGFVEVDNRIDRGYRRIFFTRALPLA